MSGEQFYKSAVAVLSKSKWQKKLMALRKKRKASNGTMSKGIRATMEKPGG
jgi:hypothetical protein